MKPSILEMHWKTVDKSLKDKKPKTKNFEKDLSLTVTIKSYISPNGVSQRVHENNPDKQFMIMGLMGHGLGIETTGSHVAFVAGTGILVFVDLVAYLIRLNLDMVNEDHGVLNKGKFKFILYASFPNRNEAVGLDLVDSLIKLNQKLNLENFEAVLRFSNEQKGERWDENFIER
jgi:hypothetical protein